MPRKIEWVVLRGKRLPDGGAERVPSGRRRSPQAGEMEIAGREEYSGARRSRPVASFTNARVEIDEMDAEQRRRARRDETVLMAAPRMPICLIKALPASRKIAKKPGKVAWGIEAVNATRSDFDGTGITVAVLDTGIQKDHPTFKGIELAHRNFTQEAPEDLDGHGTHCAGTIFGQDVDKCRIGVAPKISRALIGKILGNGGGSSEDIVKAIFWAKLEGAHVISMSLGMDFTGFRTELVKKGFEDAEATSIALAGYQQNTRLFDQISQSLITADAEVFGGAVLVAAAGNESNRPDYSIIVAPPASGEKFLSVAALGYTEKGGKKKYHVASFSNEGATVSAPGEDIWSAELGGRLVAQSGTSMAAPHVAGIAALWAQKCMKDNQLFSADWVMRRIREHTVKLGALLDPDDVGDGLVQAP